MNLYIQLLEFTGSIVQAWTELGHMFFFNQAFYQILILFNIMSILFNIYILKSYLSPCTLFSCRVKLRFLVNSCTQNWHGKLASSFKWIILICCWRVSILVKVLPQISQVCFSATRECPDKCFSRLSWVLKLCLQIEQEKVFFPSAMSIKSLRCFSFVWFSIESSISWNSKPWTSIRCLLKFHFLLSLISQSSHAQSKLWIFLCQYIFLLDVSTMIFPHELQTLSQNFLSKSVLSLYKQNLHWRWMTLWNLKWLRTFL